jgi:phage tail sheath protein FI
MANMPTTPGVYIEEIPKFPPSIAAVETAIPAFIGYTEKAVDDDATTLKLKPKRISSLVEYESYFGSPQKEEKVTVQITEVLDANGNTTLKAVADLKWADRSLHVMHYAMQMYFANGGGPCYIVSVGDYKALGTEVNQADLKLGLTALEKEDEPTLILFPEAQRLKLIGNFGEVQDLALAQCDLLKDRFVIMDLHGGDSVDLDSADANLIDAIEEFRDAGVGTKNLKYGAVYAPNIKTTIDLVVDETKTMVKHKRSSDGTDETVALDTLSGSDNKHYELAKAAILDCPCIMPPSSAMAGIYADVDNDRGVWKAPANVSVTGVIKPTVSISAVDQGGMNVDPTAGKSVNVIRSFTGRGTLVWGARTLAGNDNEWRYINVRRFFNMVEESTKKATEAFTFEPNDANTWVRVQAMIENFLTTLWRQGALQGVKPEHAFYVAVGLGKTMTALDILEGRMIVEIGMAAVRPAEFILLRFSHMMAQS